MVRLKYLLALVFLLATMLVPGSASAVPSAQIHVVVRGSDNNIWHRWWDNGWSGWENMGGPFQGDPSMVSKDSGHMEIFALGMDHAIWHKWWIEGVGWSGWESLGGYLVSGPDAVSKDANHVEVFARASDNTIWHRWYTGGVGWSNWEGMGGSLKGDPTAVSKDANHVELFATGTDNNMYHQWFTVGVGWSGWRYFGGNFPGGPDAVSRDSNHIEVFVRGHDNQIYHRWWVGGWSNWEPMGGSWLGDPGAAAKDGSHIEVVARNANGHLYHQWWTPGGWSGWHYFGGPYASSPDVAAIRTSSGGNTGTDRVSLARWIRDSPQVSLARVHPSGVVDNAFAWNNINDTANGGMAARSSYSCSSGTSPGGHTWLQTSMLSGMKALAGSWSYHVSEIAGACHSTTSRHYAGVAVDVSSINGIGVSGSNPYQWSFRSRCSQLGATEVLGPGDSGHSGHIHCAWPRP